ncbi:MAG: hypothetical protein KY457_10805 [Actinobacteria bacterium]|nr:hypothetical protein [Actinomycetota bacterium]
MSATGDAATTGAVLRADARFTLLPRPDYDIDARGLRPGTAQALTALGGFLLLLAPFGAWLRVTRLADADADVEIVQEVLGTGLAGGTALVVLAALVLPSAALWRRRSPWLRRTAHALAAAAVIVVVAMLVQLQGRIRAASAAAVEQAGFYDLVPGAGWGAWAGATGAVVLLLASAYAAFAGVPDPERSR